MSQFASNVIPLRDSEIPSSGESESGELFQGLIGEAPSCPNFLEADAKKHFRFLVSELKKSGLIAKIDMGAIAALSIDYAGMLHFEKMCQEQGELQKSPNGYYQEAPWSTLKNKYKASYQKQCNKFGITVAGRQRVKVENPNQGNLEL